MNFPSDMVERILRPVWRSISNMIVTGTATNSDDAGDSQILQALLDDGATSDGITNMLPFGFASRPIEGARGLFLAIKGWRSALACVGINDSRFRPRNLNRGDAVIYDSRGNLIWLKADGIYVNSLVKVFVTAPDVEITGEVSVTLNGAASVTVMSAGSVGIDAPDITLTGNVTVDGDMAVAGALTEAGQAVLTV